jgi:hypothetical protein
VSIAHPCGVVRFALPSCASSHLPDLLIAAAISASF